MTPEDVAKVFPRLDAKANAQIRLLWVTCGTADGLVGVNRAFRDWLNAKDVKHTYIEVPDIGHVWPFCARNWRISLRSCSGRSPHGRCANGRVDRGH